MVGFSSFKSFKALTKRFPLLSFGDAPQPTTQELQYASLGAGKLKVDTLSAEQWGVIFPALSEQLVHGLYRYLQSHEKSTYPFFLHFFDLFLRLSSHTGLTRAVAEAGTSMASPPSTPGSSPTQQAAAAKAKEEGAGSAAAAGSGTHNSLQFSDPASLKGLHEEEMRLGNVGGPIEFVFTASDTPSVFVVEVKKDLIASWEANVCQLCAQLYAVLGKNYAEVQHTGPVYGLLTDVYRWVMFEARADNNLEQGKPVKATISYSALKECFSITHQVSYHLSDEDDLQDVVAFVASRFVPDIKKESGEALLRKLEKYQSEVRTAAEKFRHGQKLRLDRNNRKRTIDECITGTAKRI